MHRPHLKFALLVGVLMTVTGCLEGPLRLGRYNPWSKKEWLKDEEYGPTLHNKLEELETIRGQVSKLPPNEQQRLSAQLLQYMQNEKNITLLMDYIHTLALFQTEESLEALRLGITHGDPDIRRAACEGWGKKRGQEPLETLAKILGSDTDTDVQIAAARELEKFKDPMAVQTLGVALDNKDAALQFRAVQSLKKITGKDYGDSVTLWREYVQSGQAKPEEATSVTQKLRNLF